MPTLVGQIPSFAINYKEINYKLTQLYARKSKIDVM